MALCPGIYQTAPARDGMLARLRLAGGRLTSHQLHTIADVAETYGNGLIDLTHRANLQIRGLSEATRTGWLQALAQSRLAAKSASRDRIRNVLVSPFAGIDAERPGNAWSVAQALLEALETAPGLEELSPKFSFAIDGGDRAGVAGLLHDIAAIPPGTEPGDCFRLSIANHPTPYGMEVHKAATAMVAMALAIVRLAPTGRAGDALATVGIDELVARAQAIAGRELFTALECAPPPSLPRACTAHLGVLPHVDGPGLLALSLGTRLGRLQPDTARALGDLGTRFGAGEVRIAPWQGAVVPGIGQADCAKALQCARHAGFAVSPDHANVRVVACAGASGCLRSKAQTKAIARAIAEMAETLPGNGGAPATIHVSGCPRRCAHPYPADLLLLADGETGALSPHFPKAREDQAGPPDSPEKFGATDVAAYVWNWLVERI